ncbi:MAG TPA: DUF6348 family protein [Pyrinomonadaceae bacterium]|nr:DUF6348 family protein [Pyrinomonadaceae bacterium]
MSETVDYLSKLFEGHGLTCVAENDWVVPNGELPAVRALWYPGESSGLLDVHALIRSGVVIEECFAGVGQGEGAIHDALMNFTLNSFHVLLAVLWGKTDPEQVTTELWVVNEKSYTAYIGNFGTRTSAGVVAHVPPSLFASIEENIKAEKLTEDIHWFRLFFCNFANEFTFEALKDNEPWERGTSCLESVAWRPDDGYYSVRLFVVLRGA